MRGRGEYTALPISEEPVQQGARAKSVTSTDNVNHLIFWATIGVACSTTLSALLFVLTILHPTDVVAPSQITPGIPHRPNPYLYLDGILANTTQNFPPITNFPPVAFQIDNADHLRSMREEDRGGPTYFGRVFPDDRRILITDKVSTIVQFRHLDYKMERCVLNILLPEPNQSFDPDVKVADPSVVDVWLLDAPTEISRYIRGSMDYAPKRRELLTTLTFSHTGPSHSRDFLCASGEFTTLELACPPTSDTCSVDFWQDQRAKPMGGLHIIQYSSGSGVVG